MFGLYDNENKSFSIFLLIAVVFLAFFSQGSGFLRPWGTVRSKEEEEVKDTITSDEIKVLFNRTIGKEEDLPERKVIEAIAEDPKENHSVLYSRVMEPKRTKKAKAPQPETKHTVLYSRRVDNSLREEKTYTPIYSRTIK
ncbi:MAG: hypothetical protein ACOWWO_13595 [Peptococcaceae bacterium]